MCPTEMCVCVYVPNRNVCVCMCPTEMFVFVCAQQKKYHECEVSFYEELAQQVPFLESCSEIDFWSSGIWIYI